MPEWYAAKPKLEIEVKETETQYDFLLKTGENPKAARL
jgi:hypothetical protein